MLIADSIFKILEQTEGSLLAAKYTKALPLWGHSGRWQCWGRSGCPCPTPQPQPGHHIPHKQLTFCMAADTLQLARGHLGK